jgi:diadenosine tetraphosphatase ApaH/serine/threonine PP2A family protein phosphatase
MRYAMLADIHGNLDAFNAVLEDIERRGGVDEYWCMGDIVGYGPEPHLCIAALRQLPNLAVKGNHDLAAAGQTGLSVFNPDAAQALRWTRENLTEEDISYLKELPEKSQKEGFTILHGSPREPLWEYLVSISSATENFNYLKTHCCLIGHSHLPLLFKQKEEENGCSFIPFGEDIGQVLGKGRFIINPGSVGQARDGDPRASYAIYDGDAAVIKLHRIAYDINAVKLKMVRQNLPVRLVIRLEHGI